MPLGLSRKTVLQLTELTRHQLYHNSSGNGPGKRVTQRTLYKDIKTGVDSWKDNEVVVTAIHSILQDPDLPNYYRLVCAQLKIEGWYINHKKVYRLEKEHGLLGRKKRKLGRKFVTYRRVNPLAPLRIIEMDIKYIWISGKNRYGYILTAIDTFTRFVLNWKVGYSMRQEQVKLLWEEIIVNYLQEGKVLENGIEVEVRNDNGKQFASAMIQGYFKENYLDQVFTHPYSPEENGHVESFHKTLGRSLKSDSYSNLYEVELRLKRFYKTYNNERTHSSIAQLPPSKFWILWEHSEIKMTTYSKKKAVFKLKCDYQKILAKGYIHTYDIK